MDGGSGQEKVLISGQPETIYHQIVIIIFHGLLCFGTCSLLFPVCGSDREIFRPATHLFLYLLLNSKSNLYVCWSILDKRPFNGLISLIGEKWVWNAVQPKSSNHDRGPDILMGTDSSLPTLIRSKGGQVIIYWDHLRQQSVLTLP